MSLREDAIYVSPERASKALEKIHGETTLVDIMNIYINAKFKYEEAKAYMRVMHEELNSYPEKERLKIFIAFDELKDQYYEKIRTILSQDISELLDYCGANITAEEFKYICDLKFDEIVIVPDIHTSLSYIYGTDDYAEFLDDNLDDDDNQDEYDRSYSIRKSDINFRDSEEFDAYMFWY